MNSTIARMNSEIKELKSQMEDLLGDIKAINELLVDQEQLIQEAKDVIKQRNPKHRTGRKG
jgi:predicted  nucleic acid-binding Zn-ribbon protein